MSKPFVLLEILEAMLLSTGVCGSKCRLYSQAGELGSWRTMPLEEMYNLLD